MASTFLFLEEASLLFVGDVLTEIVEEEALACALWLSTGVPGSNFGTRCICEFSLTSVDEMASTFLFLEEASLLFVGDFLTEIVAVSFPSEIFSPSEGLSGFVGGIVTDLSFPSFILVCFSEGTEDSD